MEAARLCGLGLERVLVLDSREGRWGLRSVAGDGRVGEVVWDGMREGERLSWERVTDETELADSVICLLYSSGTTGVPKGEFSGRIRGVRNGQEY